LGVELLERYPLQRAKDLPLERSRKAAGPGADAPRAVGVSFRELAVDLELDTMRPAGALSLEDRPRQLKKSGLAIGNDRTRLQIRERIDFRFGLAGRTPSEERLEERG
jgi:hypothetical protein